MRELEGALAERVESGAARLCHVWLLECRDGSRMGFTDHDRDLVFEGVQCRAGSAWARGTGEAQVGLEAGGWSASGALDGDALGEEDILGGRFDAARVELWRVDWADVSARVCLWAGRLNRIRREAGAFVADLEGPMAQLDRVVGRTYGRDCDAVLGDGRCGLSAEAIDGRRCDRTWKTCVRVFGNGLNFRGFPDVPGDDFILTRPQAGVRHNGKSRR
ncbi:MULTISPECIES: baseplate hub protein [unclassified Brevundimonas]|uniref:baseplate hub domain-containing protein n=1 Tax=unclassified Brevundimonas TaxID=2622653 RepID=UPI0025C23BF2|nr:MULTISPECIES: DUF2163 domain-containing protein [unclassified Brevundimonas]